MLFSKNNDHVVAQVSFLSFGARRHRNLVGAQAQPLGSGASIIRINELFQCVQSAFGIGNALLQSHAIEHLCLFRIGFGALRAPGCKDIRIK